MTQQGTLWLLFLLCISTGRAQSGAPVPDDFNGTLLNTSLWTFVNPIGDASMQMNGAEAVISLPGGKGHDVWSTGNYGARIVQPIADADFEVTAKIDSPVTAGYQMEGILVEQDSQTFLRFDLYHDGSRPHIFAGSISGTAGVVCVDLPLQSIPTPLWLKVTRSGNSWTESYSMNGTSYALAGNFTFKLTTNRIGVFAGNNSTSPGLAAPAFTAAFDYFYSTWNNQPPPGGSPPVITGLSATGVTATTATIIWTTDQPATSRVDYGTALPYAGTLSDSALVTSHRVDLSSLACATTYNYAVTSVNRQGAGAASGNQTFTTPSCAPATAGGPVSDNFDAGALNTSLWTVINPLRDGSVTANGSAAVLSVPRTSVHDIGNSTNNSVRILQSISNADFQVEARFNSAVFSGRQMQGIVVEQDSSRYICFGVYHDGVTPRLFAASFSGGVRTVKFDQPIALAAPPVYFRVQRARDSWLESWSGNGAQYTPGASFSQPLNVARIGPYAANTAGSSNTPAFSAVVDYFFNTANPSSSNLSGPNLFDRFVIDPNPPTTTLEKGFGDMDGDGRQDAVIGFGIPPGATTAQGVAWYEYPHSGNPADPWIRHTILGSGVMYEDLRVFDVNNDGAPDVIASMMNTNLYWFENPRGSGGNAATSPWPQHFIGVGGGENNMLIADIDGDGKPDLVTNAFIFFQNSSTSWTPVAYNRRSNGVTLLDIGSGMGAIDLVGMSVSSPYPFVWLENPREHGGNARTDPWLAHTIGPGYDTTGNAPAAYASGDLNGDGRMDLVTGQSEGELTPVIGSLIWWEAPADRRNGVWIKHVIDPTYTSSHMVRLVDVDGNGTLDIVTSEQEQSLFRRVSVFYNAGSGNFTEQILSSGSGHNTVPGVPLRDGVINILNAGHGYFGAPHPIEIFRRRP